MRLGPFHSFLAATVILCAVATAAQAVAPKLTLISPSGGKRGTELKVNFYGERLQHTEEVICYEPGLEILKFDSVTNKVVKARIKIAPDCRLGEHHLRLRAADGFSELMTFFVGAYPVVAEVEPNSETARAQKIQLNTTVTGVITNEDVDCFAVDLKKGQLLSAEVEGMRLGRGVFDPRLAVLDIKGEVLADVDDTRLTQQDPFISLVAPADGTYTIRLREATYGGKENCHYRLHIGSFARPTVIFPLGGKTGETVTFAFYSEAMGEFTQAVKLPVKAEEKFGVFAEKDGLIAPSPNWIRVSESSDVTASGANQNLAHATVATVCPPLAFNGVISEKGGEHWFRFPATKDVALEVNVFARRLRSSLDSAVEVFDAAGKSVANNDDTAGADSYLKFTPSASTNYYVRVRDAMRRGGRDFGYRVEITPADARVALKIPEVARNDTQSRQFIAISRGNRFATLINAKRANFGGELTFSITNLPTGVTLQADTMAKNIDSMPLVFEAAADAPVQGGLRDLTASGSNGNRTVTGHYSQEVELVPGPNNTVYYATSVDRIGVAVTKEAPFKIAIVPPEVPLVQAGSMRLEVRVERAEGFEEPIKLQMVWNPPGVSSQSEVLIPKGATNAFYPLNAAAGAETRSWGIAVLGHATLDDGKQFVSSQLARLEVAAPYVTGKMETTWANPGKPGHLTVALECPKAFDGKATVKLCGLPDKVTAPDREITKDDKEVIFDLTVDPKCPLSTFKNLFCAVDVPERGQTISHTIASGGILRVAPPKKEVTRLAGAEKAGK